MEKKCDNKNAKEFVYSQETGVLHYRQGDEVTRIGKGYAGSPPFVNDPSAEALVARGPIPRGSYRCSWAFRHVRLGPVAIFLEPDPSNDMHGRSGFFIHGDNAFGNQTASNGCIVLSRPQRERIEALLPKCRTLVVV